MVSPNGGTKTCAVCRRDCARQPRIKDKKGRYFHRQCFIKAKAKLNAKKAREARAKEQVVMPSSGSMTTLDDLGGSEIAPAAVPVASPSCPNCGAIMPPDGVLCTNCGYNRQTGELTPQALAAAPTPEPIKPGRSAKLSISGSAATGLFKNPVVIWGGVIGLFLILFLTAKASAGVAALYIGVTFVFCLAVWIWAIAAAFIEGVVHGILSLVCDFYRLYYVLFVNSNTHLKIAYALTFLTLILLVFSLDSLGLLPDSEGLESLEDFGTEDLDTQSISDTD